MPRKKEYDESVVVSKALNVFWEHGFHQTSVRMLEEAMGINQFSIYSSFKSKDGLFIACIKAYRDKVKQAALEKLIASPDEIESIRIYFYDFLAFTRSDQGYKGCLLVNTMNELAANMDENVRSEINEFANLLLTTFQVKLMNTKGDNVAEVERYANHLFVTLQCMSIVSKFIPKEQLDDYIDVAFEHL